MSHEASLTAAQRRADLVEAKALANPAPLLLVAIGAATFAGFFWHPRAYVIGSVLFVLMVIGLVIPWVSTRLCRVEVRPQRRRGRVGQPTPVEVLVRGSRWTPLRGIVLDAAHDADWSASSLLAIAWLARGKGQQLVWKLTPSRRGRFPQGDLEVSCSAPFRARTSRVRQALEPEALIWPEVVELPTNALDSRSSAGRRRNEQLEGVGAEGQISAPRPYRPGEPARRIHWPQSAWRNQLIVCERETEQAEAARLRLELGPLEMVGHEATEAEIAIAASLATAYALQPSGVRFEAPGGRVFVCRDARALHPLLDHLALLDPATSDATSTGGNHDDHSLIVATQPGTPGGPAGSVRVAGQAVSIADWRVELPQLWETRLG